jgi:hypothetical protein
MSFNKTSTAVHLVGFSGLACASALWSEVVAGRLSVFLLRTLYALGNPGNTKKVTPQTSAVAANARRRRSGD